MLDRTFLRPRDIIDFFNRCLERAEGKTRFSAEIVRDAEVEYSHGRLHSLITEWSSRYPHLETVLRIFSGLNDKLVASELSEAFFQERLDELLPELADPTIDPITSQLSRLYQPQANFATIRSYVLQQMFLTGVLGVKASPTTAIRWSYESRPSSKSGELTGKSTFYIHPTFHRALEIRSSRR